MGINVQNKSEARSASTSKESVQSVFKKRQEIMSTTNNSRFSWANILNAIIQAIVAALTALGVSSCATVYNCF